MVKRSGTCPNPSVAILLLRSLVCSYTGILAISHKILTLKYFAFTGCTICSHVILLPLGSIPNSADTMVSGFFPFSLSTRRLFFVADLDEDGVGN